MSRGVDLPFADLLDISTMTLATTDLEGNPHAAPVYFSSVNIEGRLHLYFFSSADSLHSHHIGRNPKAAAAIYPACQGWHDIKGLQLRGEIFSVESSIKKDTAWVHYQRKFPFVRSLKAVVAQNQLFVFIPNWVRLVDNAKGFGYKKEWNFL